MSKCKVAYSSVQNAGDQFNEALVDYFHVDAQHSGLFDADLVMLGGLLSFLQPEESLKLRLYQQYLRLRSDMDKPLHVYGSGFLIGSRDNKFYRKNVVVHALRGEMSRKKVEAILQKKVDVPLCDPGLLAREFVNAKIEKRYQVGIIAHFREQDNPLFEMLSNSYRNAHIINIKKDYHDVLREIASCEYILSSSLHGLIFSDSLGIPNLHIVADRGEALKGDGFKFNDYYSSFGVEHNSFAVDLDHIPSLNDVIDQYKISGSVVEDKIEAMIQAFPKELL